MTYDDLRRRIWDMRTLAEEEARRQIMRLASSFGIEPDPSVMHRMSMLELGEWLRAAWHVSEVERELDRLR